MNETPERWDIFCRVVDNYGDVGVSWRLARQVAREHGKEVRLWLDDLTVLAKLRPEIDTAYDAQKLDGVEVRLIREPFDLDGIADVVVETFGCDPPEPYVLAMAERSACSASPSRSGPLPACSRVFRKSCTSARPPGGAGRKP